MKKGDLVRLIAPLRYLKTVDSPTMLRPPDLVSLEEFGEIINIHDESIAEVAFRRGTFQVPLDKLCLKS